MYICVYWRVYSVSVVSVMFGRDTTEWYPIRPDPTRPNATRTDATMGLPANKSRRNNAAANKRDPTRPRNHRLHRHDSCRVPAARIRASCVENERANGANAHVVAKVRALRHGPVLAPLRPLPPRARRRTTCHRTTCHRTTCHRKTCHRMSPNAIEIGTHADSSQTAPKSF